MTERSDGVTGAAFHLSKPHHFLRSDIRAGKMKLDIAASLPGGDFDSSEETDCIAGLHVNEGPHRNVGQTGNSIRPDQGGINHDSIAFFSSHSDRKTHTVLKGRLIYFAPLNIPCYELA